MNLQIASIRTQLLSKIDKLARAVPLDVNALAAQLGVVEISPRALDFDGYLALRPDGKLAIRYRENACRTRIRFTIAHEIGHILIAQELGNKITTPIARDGFRDDAEEQLADRIAAELLMPGHLVGAMLRKSRIDWSTVNELAQSFDVSMGVVIRRFKELKCIRHFEIIVDASKLDAQCGWTRFNHERSIRLCFHEPPRSLQRRLLCELNRSGQGFTSHSLRVWFGESTEDTRCLGRFIPRTSDQVAQFFHWSFFS